MTDYYDVILGLIPVSLLGVAGLLYGVGFTSTLAIPLGGLVAAGLVAHALFVNAPVGTLPRDPGRFQPD
jgi:hypothetical protein